MDKTLPSLDGQGMAPIVGRMNASRPRTPVGKEWHIAFEGLPVASARRIKDQGEIEHLRRLVHPVLDFHRRGRSVRIILFRDPRPVAMTRMGAVLALSTGLLEALDREEILAVVAHEMGHMYVSRSFNAASRRGDRAKMRSLELYSDALAVVTLIKIGVDPENLSTALSKIYQHPTLRGMNSGQGDHPALSARIESIKKLSQELGKYSL